MLANSNNQGRCYYSWLKVFFRKRESSCSIALFAIKYEIVPMLIRFTVLTTLSTSIFSAYQSFRNTYCVSFSLAQLMRAAVMADIIEVYLHRIFYSVLLIALAAFSERKNACFLSRRFRFYILPDIRFTNCSTFLKVFLFF